MGLFREPNPSFPPWPQMTMPDVHDANILPHYTVDSPVKRMIVINGSSTTISYGINGI